MDILIKSDWKYTDDFERAMRENMNYVLIDTVSRANMPRLPNWGLGGALGIDSTGAFGIIRNGTLGANEVEISDDTSR